MVSAASELLENRITPLRTVLAFAGFRARKRTFNRKLSNGIIHVVQVSMGRFDPPGTAEIPGFRTNAYGTFSIDLGVFLPEVAKLLQHWRPVSSFPGEVDCCVRRNLGDLFPNGRAMAPDIDVPETVYEELAGYLHQYALPFFASYADRDLIVSQLSNGATYGAGGAPRVIAAIILASTGLHEDARRLLHEQERLVDRQAQREYVREIADKLGIVW